MNKERKLKDRAQVTIYSKNMENAWKIADAHFSGKMSRLATQAFEEFIEEYAPTKTNSTEENAKQSLTEFMRYFLPPTAAKQLEEHCSHNEVDEELLAFRLMARFFEFIRENPESNKDKFTIIGEDDYLYLQECKKFYERPEVQEEVFKEQYKSLREKLSTEEQIEHDKIKQRVTREIINILPKNGNPENTKHTNS